MVDYKTILLRFIGSLSLADHMGDVSNDVDEVLKQIGEGPLLDEVEALDDDGEFFPAVRKVLHKRGITTLYGTALGDE